MRILYNTNAVIPSRSAHSAHGMKMCEAFARNGHEVILLAPFWENRQEPDVQDLFEFYGTKQCFEIDIAKHSWGTGKVGTYFAFLRAMAQISARFRPHLVYGPFACGCFFATLWGNRAILEGHVPFWEGHKLENFFFSRLIRRRNFLKLVVISQALKDIYLKAGYLSNDEILVAHNGAQDDCEKDAVIPWPGRKGCLQVGYVGHLYPGRGIELIISLAKELPQVDFHLVGGRKEDLLSWQAKPREPNVIFHGHVAPRKVCQYRRHCDVLLAPYQTRVSSAGGQGDSSEYMSPMKVFEYMASKKPIVASDLPVLREILSDRNAILVPPQDIAGWKAALNRLKSESLRRRLALKAFEDFKKKYQWTERAKRVLYDI